jgi:hypothetical protein
MASTAYSIVSLDQLPKPNVISVSVIKSAVFDPDHNLGVGFNGLSAEEVRTLVDCAIKIEQARTGDVLTPTEYGNRFAALDLGDEPC